ncbi:MAG: hypothetical protein Q4B40_00720 [Clostridia bacterium]|nr:hypothetical protein [Clostridia bacterium]
MKFSIPQKYRLGQLVYKKRFTVVLSVVVAFAMWLGISMTENPIREQTFVDLSATISLENTAASGLGLGIISDVASQKFSVTVSGPNYIVSSLRAEDFILSASTIDINAAGTYTLEIITTNNSNKSGYTIDAISPATIDVTVDFIDSKDFVIVPKLIGVTAADGLVAEEPVVADDQQSTITIKGPRSVIEKIGSVGAIADVNSVLDASQTFNSDVVIYDTNDEVLYRYTADGTVYDAKDNIITNSYLTLSFTNIKVTQPISKKKVVDCKVTFKNMPDGMTEKDISYTISQDKLSVIGAPEIIDKLDSIELPAIDFRAITPSNGSFEISPTLPEGVKLAESKEPLTVTIDVSNFAEITVDIKDIRCTGTNLKTKTDRSIRVKICGPKDVVDKIDATKLFALVDVTDKTAGDYTVEAVIGSELYKNIWQVDTYNVSVKIY